MSAWPRPDDPRLADPSFDPSPLLAALAAGGPFVPLTAALDAHCAAAAAPERRAEAFLGAAKHRLADPALTLDDCRFVTRTCVSAHGVGTPGAPAALAAALLPRAPALLAARFPAHHARALVLLAHRARVRADSDAALRALGAAWTNAGPRYDPAAVDVDCAIAVVEAPWTAGVARRALLVLPPTSAVAVTLAAKAATRAVGATEAWDPRRYALVPREDLVLRGVAATYHLEQHRDPEPVATLVAFTLSVSAAARPTHAQSELYRTFLPVAAAALAKAVATAPVVCIQPLREVAHAWFEEDPADPFFPRTALLTTLTIVREALWRVPAVWILAVVDAVSCLEAARPDSAEFRAILQTIVQVAGTDRAFVKGLGELLRDAAASFATTRASRWLPRWSLLLAVAAALPPAAGPGVAVVVPPALTAAREPSIAVRAHLAIAAAFAAGADVPKFLPYVDFCARRLPADDAVVRTMAVAVRAGAEMADTDSLRGALWVLSDVPSSGLRLLLAALRVVPASSIAAVLDRTQLDFGAEEQTLFLQQVMGTFPPGAKRAAVGWFLERFPSAYVSSPIPAAL